MFDVGGGEIFLIVLAILLLFGPEKLPELMRSLGKGLSHVRQAQTEFQRNLNAMADEVEEVVQKQPSAQTASAEPPSPLAGDETPVHERSLAPPAEQTGATPPTETPLDVALGQNQEQNQEQPDNPNNEAPSDSISPKTEPDNSASPPALTIQPAPNAVPRGDSV